MPDSQASKFKESKDQLLIKSGNKGSVIEKEKDKCIYTWKIKKI